MASSQQRLDPNRAAANTNTGARGRVLVVDDCEAFLRAAAAVVSEAKEVRLVGEASSGHEALRLLPELRPDLVLLDVHLRGIDGVETAGVIRRREPKTVVFLVSAEPDGLEAAARSAGAAAFLDKRDLRPRTLDGLWLKHRPRE
jgi:two-component system nitrate/nitrite response regulator NarL